MCCRHGLSFNKSLILLSQTHIVHKIHPLPPHGLPVANETVKRTCDVSVRGRLLRSMLSSRCSTSAALRISLQCARRSHVLHGNALCDEWPSVTRRALSTLRQSMNGARIYRTLKHSPWPPINRPREFAACLQAIHCLCMRRCSAATH
jgi:hypothetical protein